MVAIMSGADNGFFYAGQVMHFSSPFTVFLIYHKHPVGYPNSNRMVYNTSITNMGRCVFHGRTI